MNKKLTEEENKLENDSFYFLANLTKRYYHFVVVSLDNDLDFQRIWEKIPFKLSDKEKHIVNRKFSEIEIQQRQIESNMPFRRSDENDTEIEPPYFYDLFIIKIENQLVILFPFRILAKRCIEELVNFEGLEFWKLNMNDYVQSNYQEISKEIYSDFGMSVLGLDVGLKGEDNINSVSIAGEHPLDSEFYKDFLKNPIESNTYTINNVNLKGSTLLTSDSYPKSRARVHLDFYGNGKFYLHVRGKNLIILALMWQSLIRSKCLASTKDNPIPRLKKDRWN